jgi:hypothetical protein
MAAAPRQNQFWKLRSKQSRDKIFSDPSELWLQACEYFNYCDKQPLKAQRVFGTGKRMTENKMRAYTLSGLCFFLKCDEQTLRNYGNKPEYGEFHEVVKWINQVCFTQKFQGAAAGLLDSRIISRDLGLRDANDLNIKFDLEKKLAEYYENGVLNEDGLKKLASLIVQYHKTTEDEK